jgi:hypothetical protein
MREKINAHTVLVGNLEGKILSLNEPGCKWGGFGRDSSGSGQG